MANLETIEDPCSPWPVADAARIEFNAGGKTLKELKMECDMVFISELIRATQPEPAAKAK